MIANSGVSLAALAVFGSFVVRQQRHRLTDPEAKQATLFERVENGRSKVLDWPWCVDVPIAFERQGIRAGVFGEKFTATRSQGLSKPRLRVPGSAWR